MSSKQLNKRTRNRNNNRQRRTNPLYAVPRGLKLRLNFDGSIASGNTYVSSSPTAANVGSDYHVVGTTSGLAVSRSIQSMTDLYELYKYMQCSIEWIPNMGPGGTDSGSRVYIAYLDSPERIVAWIAFTQAQRLANIKNIKNMRMFNAWERFTYNVPLTYRRKIFEVDTTNVVITEEEVDRSIQGLVVVCYESVSAVATLGNFKMNFRMMLEGLVPNFGT